MIGPAAYIFLALGRFMYFSMGLAGLKSYIHISLALYFNGFPAAEARKHNWLVLSEVQQVPCGLKAM